MGKKKFILHKGGKKFFTSTEKIGEGGGGTGEYWAKGKPGAGGGGPWCSRGSKWRGRGHWSISKGKKAYLKGESGEKLPIIIQ